MERGSAGGVIICGLGPIGREVGRLTAYAPGIAAVVDLDPAAVEAFFEEVKAPAPTFSSLRDALEAAPGARVFLCTRSSFLEIAPDLRAAARVGSSVITSCEEAAWPFARYPEASREIDDCARQGNSVILGLGINPGFLMDLLPAILAAPFPEPESIAVTRRVDIATRRIPLQEKVGLGLTVEEFQRRKETTGIGHRGLGESIHLLGAALGLTWEKVETDVEPVLAEQEIATSTGIVPRGGVIGMRNWGHAHLGGLCRVRLDLLMASGLEDPTDSVELLGPPPFPVRIAAEGGVPGDRGTAHVLCAALPRLRAVAPGLRTVLDLPGGVRGWWGSRSATPSA